MPKMPKFEEWTPPWGEDDEKLDVEKAKKLIYDLKVDKETLQDRVTAITTERDTAVQERDNAKRALDDKSREGESETDKLKREVQELKDAAEAAAKAPKTDPVDLLKLEVALEKGMTLVQAKRLVGTTKEELEADADELVKSFGGNGKGADDDDDNGARGRPRQVRNAGDPDPDAGTPLDVDKALAQIPRF